MRYYYLVIRNWLDPDAKRIWDGERVRSLPQEIQRTARRKLVYLDSAQTLDDLRVPPGNRLEALVGDRVGQHSIRINDQYRICFRWTDEGPEDVEIVDYH